INSVKGIARDEIMAVVIVKNHEDAILAEHVYPPVDRRYSYEQLLQEYSRMRPYLAQGDSEAIIHTAADVASATAGIETMPEVTEVIRGVYAAIKPKNVVFFDAYERIPGLVDYNGNQMYRCFGLPRIEVRCHVDRKDCGKRYMEMSMLLAKVPEIEGELSHYEIFAASRFATLFLQIDDDRYVHASIVSGNDVATIERLVTYYLELYGYHSVYDYKIEYL
ncbi:MAG: hypothetical protein K2K77_00495, partial [Duncaniella sp.]|nr:hypothetical protein [Duncaniella sp.]